MRIVKITDPQLPGRFLFKIVEKLRHSLASFYRFVVGKGQLRRVTKLETRADPPADKTAGAVQSRKCFSPLLRFSENAEINPGVTSIRTHFNFSDRGKADPRIAHFLRDYRADLVLQFFSQSVRPEIHKTGFRFQFSEYNGQFSVLNDH